MPTLTAISAPAMAAHGYETTDVWCDVHRARAQLELLGRVASADGAADIEAEQVSALLVDVLNRLRRAEEFLDAKE